MRNCGAMMRQPDTWPLAWFVKVLGPLFHKHIIYFLAKFLLQCRGQSFCIIVRLAHAGKQYQMAAN